MPGKPNRPLFELLREPPKQQPRDIHVEAPGGGTVEAKPPTSRPAAPSRIEVMRPGLEAREAAATASEPFIRVRKSAAYLVVAGVFVVALVVWIIAFTRGKAVGVNETERKFGVLTQPAQPAGDPLNGTPGQPPQAGPGPSTSQDPPVNADPRKSNAAKPQPKKGAPPPAALGVTAAQVGAGAGDILTPNGRTATDPRVPGMNYLVLTILAEEEAAEAVAFLARNGLDSFAVPNKADRRASSGRKTSVLIVSGGITAEQYKKDPTRTQLEQAAAKLGVAWKKQGGSVDFAQYYWQKYDR
jgi:hypothetical protein